MHPASLAGLRLLRYFVYNFLTYKGLATYSSSSYYRYWSVARRT